MQKGHVESFHGRLRDVERSILFQHELAVIITQTSMSRCNQCRSPDLYKVIIGSPDLYVYAIDYEMDLRQRMQGLNRIAMSDVACRARNACFNTFIELRLTHVLVLPK